MLQIFLTVRHHRVRSKDVQNPAQLSANWLLSTDLQQHTGSHLCSGTLWSTRASTSVFPPCKTILTNRDRMRDAERVGELLLALHVRLGIGQHDPSFHRNQGVSTVPVTWFLDTERVDGPNDHVQGPRGRRD